MQNYVFVLDTNKQPLNPIPPKRARELLTKQKAAVFRMYPFTIILNHEVSNPAPKPLTIKLDPGSKITGIAVLDGENVNKRKRDRLGNGEECSLLQLALEVAEISIWDWDLVTGVVNWLPKGKKISQKLSYQGFLEIVHSEDKQRVANAIAFAIAEKQNYELEFRIVTSLGCLQWVRSKGQVFCDRNGKPVRLVAVDVDISQQKQTEQALKAKERFIQHVADSTPGIIYIYDLLEQQNIYVNHQIQPILGYKPAEIQQMGAAFFPTLMHPEDLANLGKMYQQLATLADGESLEVEYRMRHKNGEWRWLLSRNTVFLRNIDGLPQQILGTATDISKRKQAEQALLESEQRFRCLIDQAQDGILVINSEGWIVEANQRACLDLGYSYAEILTLGLWDFDANWFQERVSQLFERQMGLVAGDTIETIIQRKDNSMFPVEIRLGLLEWNQEQYMLALVRDITKRQRAEQVQSGLIDFLQESDERFRQMSENIRDIFWMRQVYPPKMLYISPAYEEIWGRSCTSWYQHPNAFLDAVHPDDRDRVLMALVQQMQGESTDLEYRILPTNQTVRWIHDRGFPIRNAVGEVYRITGIAEDITERKLAQEQRFRSLVNNIPGVIYRCALDSDWTMNYISDAIADLSGYPATDFIGNQVRTFASIIHPEDILNVAKSIRTAVFKQKAFAIEYRIVHSDGRIKWVSNKGQAKYSVNGELWLDGAIFDVSERILAEDALKTSEQRQAFLLRSLPVALYTAKKVADNFILTWVSPNIAQQTGFSDREYLQNPNLWLDRIHPQDRERAWQKFEALVNKQAEYDTEYRWQCADGTYRWFLDQAVFIDEGEDAGKEIIGSWLDITHRKQAEEEVKNALEKEKELSELKSCFITMASHEFRTPLSTILSSADLLEYYIQDGLVDKQLEHIKRIQTACLNMTDLLNDVLVIGKTESGKLEFNPAPIDLKEFCRDLVEEMQLSAGNQHQINLIDLTQEQPQNIPAFLPCLDEKLLRYILTNLLSNAIKYSPKDQIIILRFFYQDGNAILQVEDRGIGISPEDEEHLFEPFQRGKNVGTISGTGLGLAIVKRSVNMHGGEIHFRSTIGVGTTFTIKLPLYRNCKV